MSKRISEHTARAIALFAEKKRRYDKATKQFGEYKAEFEEAMEECFEHELAGTRKNITVDVDGKSITVTRVAKTTIEWFADKLRQHVMKEVFSQCVKKRYEISDMKGLTRYLKSCGVDPKIFKQFISVEEVIDPDAIDRVSERGLLETRDIRGCYLVHCSKPYYQIRVKKGAQEDE